MSKMYVIQWKSLVNGRAGRGTKLFAREHAARLVEELNLEYPQIQHEMVEADRHSQSTSVRSHAQPESTNQAMELAEVE
jgi:hypothetical protein